jgi:hypothetical protein
MSWQLIDQLPISRTARDQLRAFVDSSLDEYEKFTQAGQLTDDAGGLAGLTTAERLRGLEPETVAIITSAIKGESVADPGQLSAQYALRYFASYLAHEQHNRLYPVDGMQSIPQAMVNQLPAGTVRLQAHVDRIAFDDETSSYTLTLASGPETIRAREVVVAVPAPITRQIVSGLPQWKDEALAMALMPGSTTYASPQTSPACRRSQGGHLSPSPVAHSMPSSTHIRSRRLTRTPRRSPSLSVTATPRDTDLISSPTRRRPKRGSRTSSPWRLI